MAGPICNVCGLSAYPAQAWMHKACAVANKVPNKVANTPKSESMKPDPVANKHGVYADKEKRRAYMREYMAKRRIK